MVPLEQKTILSKQIVQKRRKKFGGVNNPGNMIMVNVGENSELVYPASLSFQVSTSCCFLSKKWAELTVKRFCFRKKKEDAFLKNDIHGNLSSAF